MSGDVSIRRARTNDIAGVLALVREYWSFEGIAPFEARSVEAQLQFILSKPELATLFVAARADTLVGYLLLVYVFSLENLGLTSEIDELFVLSSDRDSGVGRALLSAAEEASRAAGCTAIALQLGIGNGRARRFYERAGYGVRSGFGLLHKSLAGV